MESELSSRIQQSPHSNWFLSILSVNFFYEKRIVVELFPRLSSLKSVNREKRQISLCNGQIKRLIIQNVEDFLRFKLKLEEISTELKAGSKVC